MVFHEPNIYWILDLEGQVHLRLVLRTNEQEEPTATPNIVGSVTYYSELHNAITIYCILSHFLPTKVKLVVWIL